MPEYPLGQRAPEDRVDAYCHSCKQYDRHPRHVVDWGADGVTYKHFDCCEADGCPDGSCGEHLVAAGRMRGDDLVRYLHSPAGQAVIDRLNARFRGEVA